MIRDVKKRSSRLKLPKKVRTEQDVRDFFKYLILVDRSSFHPDDSFKDYIRRDWSPAFTPKEAAIRDSLMEQSWDVVGERVYDLAISLTETYAHPFRGSKDWSPYDS
jgi:hypothetical protein